MMWFLFLSFRGKQTKQEKERDATMDILHVWKTHMFFYKLGSLGTSLRLMYIRRCFARGICALIYTFAFLMTSNYPFATKLRPAHKKRKPLIQPTSSYRTCPNLLKPMKRSWPTREFPFYYESGSGEWQALILRHLAPSTGKSLYLLTSKKTRQGSYKQTKVWRAYIQKQENLRCQYILVRPPAQSSP
jgi:hypothetical protein